MINLKSLILKVGEGWVRVRVMLREDPHPHPHITHPSPSPHLPLTLTPTPSISSALTPTLMSKKLSVVFFSRRFHKVVKSNDFEWPIWTELWKLN